MDITKWIAELRQNRHQIDEAIMIFERLALNQPRRRGRPPASASQRVFPKLRPARISHAARANEAQGVEH